jgi:hypothetical protein
MRLRNGHVVGTRPWRYPRGLPPNIRNILNECRYVCDICEKNARKLWTKKMINTGTEHICVECFAKRRGYCVEPFKRYAKQATWLEEWAPRIPVAIPCDHKMWTTVFFNSFQEAEANVKTSNELTEKDGDKRRAFIAWDLLWPRTD